VLGIPVSIDVVLSVRWNQLVETFTTTYGEAPSHIVRAPGCVTSQVVVLADLSSGGSTSFVGRLTGNWADPY
jgi:hypothetical protein